MSFVKTRRAKSVSIGFSLVELMVVVMVVLVIAAIAVPSLLHARMRANEAAAVASMKTIQTAETLYALEFPEVGYAPSLARLGPNGSDCEKPGPTNACLIMDETLTGGLKSGYVFEIVGDGRTPSSDYTLTATPESAGVSGRCGFSSSQAGDVSVIPTGGQGRFAMGAGGCD
ncbi:MAG: prepilin-type N-terminal cleavage/methylation domain-containing protein [Candidatus Angelobacter sp.]